MWDLSPGALVPTQKDKAEIDRAQTYLQPHYCNWVFGNVYLFSWTTLRGKHCRHPIAVMGVVDTFEQDPLNMPFEIWCANIAPERHKLRKTVKIGKKMSKNTCFFKYSSIWGQY